MREVAEVSVADSDEVEIVDQENVVGEELKLVQPPVDSLPPSDTDFNLTAPPGVRNRQLTNNGVPTGPSNPSAPRPPKAPKLVGAKKPGVRRQIEVRGVAGSPAPAIPEPSLAERLAGAGKDTSSSTKGMSGKGRGLPAPGLVERFGGGGRGGEGRGEGRGRGGARDRKSVV